MTECISLTLVVFRKSFLRASELGQYLYLFKPELKSDYDNASRRAEC